jgi:hypothetical protein
MAEGQKSRIQTLKEHVAAAEKSPTRATFDVPFRDKQISLVKIRVKTDFPLYRIQTGRTHKKQLAYLRQHRDHLPKDFFHDPEDPRVQAAQHEILLELISEKNLDDDLKHRPQANPIVLTKDGYIVDGNRRVAALRTQKADYVTAVVLPEDADPLDIYLTEFELQLVQDTKAEYDWLDELIHLKYGQEELKGSLDSFARRKRMSKNELKAEMAKLHMVEMYLAWLGEPGAFDRIPDEARGGSMRQAFTELTERMGSKAVKKLSKPARDTIQHACFAAIKNKEGYQAIRNIINHLTRNPQGVIDLLAEDEKLRTRLEHPAQANGAASNGKKQEGDAKNSDPLRKLAQAEEAETPPPYVKLAGLFSKPEDAEAVAAPLVRAAEELEDEAQEGRRLKDPVKFIERAEKIGSVPLALPAF